MGEGGSGIYLTKKMKMLIVVLILYDRILQTHLYIYKEHKEVPWYLFPPRRFLHRQRSEKSIRGGGRAPRYFTLSSPLFVSARARKRPKRRKEP